MSCDAINDDASATINDVLGAAQLASLATLRIRLRRYYTVSVVVIYILVGIFL